MGRVLIGGLAICLLASSGFAQSNRPPPDSRTVLGAGNQLLADGADAIRAGLYDEGIRLTHLGLERGRNSLADEAAGLSNLCAAYAAQQRPDAALVYCTESLAINPGWRAYSNRAYAYWLKGMHAEATLDIEAASAINPEAKQIMQIRGMLNEAGLRPRITMEEHQ